jgi:hypothetical protein
VLESTEGRLLIVQHAADRNAASKDLRSHTAGTLDVGPAHVAV